MARPHPAGPRHGELLPGDLPPGGAPGSPPDDLAALEPGVWPATAERVDGVLHLGGRSVVDLAATHGTPAFLLDTADLTARITAWRDAFGRVSAAAPSGGVFYACKAFLCTTVARWMVDAGFGLDVATGGELAVAMAAGVDPARLLVHGNNKSLAELNGALAAGAGLLVLDSFTEIERLASLAKTRGVAAKVLVRVTVGVEAHTHEFIATAHEDQKFGFSLAGGDAAEAVRRVLAEPSLELVGLHSHIGSQIFDTSGFEVAAHRVVGLLAQVRDTHGVELPLLDLGGGLGIAYTAADDPQPVDQIAKLLRGIVERECSSAGLAVPALAVEPGRAVVGPSMITLYEVGTVKPVLPAAGRAPRHYISIDGGMSDNIRTALYGARYTVVVANRTGSSEAVLARVVGKHCETGDVVVTDCWLPADIRPGDLLAVAATGAYCRSMASNYQQVLKPPVVAVGADGEQVLLRRESTDDLLRLDVGA